MIEAGSTIVLRTIDAIYETCKIVAMSGDNITVAYFAGTKKDGKTGKMREDNKVEIISRRKIVSMSERL